VPGNVKLKARPADRSPLLTERLSWLRSLLPTVFDLWIVQRCGGRGIGLGIGDFAIHHGQQHSCVGNVFDTDLIQIVGKHHQVGLLALGDRTQFVELADQLRTANSLPALYQKVYQLV